MKVALCNETVHSLVGIPNNRCSYERLDYLRQLLGGEGAAVFLHELYLKEATYVLQEITVGIQIGFVEQFLHLVPNLVALYLVSGIGGDGLAVGIYLFAIYTVV